MEQYLYVKVLLYAYPKLPMLEEATRSGAEVQAALSFRAYGDAAALAEKIMEEILYANKLHLLALALDEAVGECGETEQFLLEYKYFRRKAVLRDRFSGMEIASSERNYYRLQNALLSKMAGLLARRGYTEKRFFEEFGAFAPFMRVYRALKAGKERAVVRKRTKQEIAFRRQNSSAAEDLGRLPRRTKTAIATSANTAAQITAIWTGEGADEGAPSDGS